MSDFAKDTDVLISRQAAIEAVDIGNLHRGIVEALQNIISEIPSAQTEDWMERNKERILQAGMEGREIEFRIGGRLFAIREKAQ